MAINPVFVFATPINHIHFRLIDHLYVDYIVHALYRNLKVLARGVCARALLLYCQDLIIPRRPQLYIIVLKRSGSLRARLKPLIFTFVLHNMV